MSVVVKQLPDAAQVARDQLAALLEAARQRGDCFAETVNVDSALAQAILDLNNPRNRKVNPKLVQNYAKQIEQGQWLQTGEPVKFSVLGQLEDGQHRLLALVQTGLTLPLLLCFNTDPEAFAVMDTGKRRSAAEAFAHVGYRNGSVLAAAARALWRIEYSGGVGRDVITHRDLIAYVSRRHPELIWCVPTGQTLARALRISGAGAIASYYLIRNGSEQAGRLDEFWDKLQSGASLSRNSPILRLRNKIQQDDRAETACPLAALIILCWNAWIKDDESKPSVVTWDREPFPTVL